MAFHYKLENTQIRAGHVTIFTMVDILGIRWRGVLGIPEPCAKVRFVRLSVFVVNDSQAQAGQAGPVAHMSPLS